MIGSNLLKLPLNCGFMLKKLPQSISINCVRHGHRLRGKPPGIARTIAQRLAGNIAKL